MKVRNKICRWLQTLLITTLTFTFFTVTAEPLTKSQQAAKAFKKSIDFLSKKPSEEMLESLLHKREKGYGALSPQNLTRKELQNLPFNVTGTWFVDLRKGFSDYMFGHPYPEFYEAGIQALEESVIATKEGRTYRDSIGQCFPPGMPMIMTRVWPIAMIQQPTSIYMVFGFTNSLRIIYMDGRDFSDPDYVVPTYNGESIGHWEDDELVVHTKYFETNEHWIDMGIPVSDDFEIIERIRMKDEGMTLEIEYTMIDPQNWKGEWKNTKRWMRQDYSDIGEVECLPDLNEHMPGTDKGKAALEK